MTNAFLGTGWTFPIRIDASGELALVGGDECVHQGVRVILGTRLGERAMRPDFGGGLEALAFEPLSAATAALARHRVEQALIRFEPRIDVLAVRAGPAADPAERALGRLDIEVDYRVRTTNTFYNLVYPYYLVEGGQR
jgi:phage baseplate assembly protein W